MSDRVLRLVSDNPSPRKPACTTCLHYHPTLARPFGQERVIWNFIWPFRHVYRVPDAGSYEFAKCSYYGGHRASHAREFCEGENWEPEE